MKSYLPDEGFETISIGGYQLKKGHGFNEKTIKLFLESVERVLVERRPTELEMICNWE